MSCVWLMRLGVSTALATGLVFASAGIRLPAAPPATVAAMPASLETSCPDHYYLGNNPSASDAPDWSDNAQGVANDGRHWYFTHQFGLLKYEANWTPVSAEVDAGHILSVPIPQELAVKGINHFGDPDYFEGYIFVPFESDGNDDDELVAAIAVFRASTLALVDWVDLEPTLRRTGWLAIDPVEQKLYTSTDVLVAGTPLMRYSLNLLNLGRDDREFLADPEPVSVQNFPVGGKFQYMQGGVFTPWGDLYLSVGKTAESDDIRGGLHLLRRNGDGTGFQLIESSVNREEPVGSPVFSYRYDSGFEDLGEEPEGLDWWNRDAAPDSPYPGQLHAILLDNQAIGDSNIWLKHYRVAYHCRFSDDTDGDGIIDGAEAYLHNTHPLLADTDRDGQSDGNELTCGSDPLDSLARAPDADGDHLPDCREIDDDNDGQTDEDEIACGSDPADATSRAPDLDGDHLPDCVDTDDDDDGIADAGDLCPATPLSLGTIQHEACDSGVGDFVMTGERSGCSVSQWIDRLAATSRSRGQLVSQVDKLLTDLQKQGLLLPQQKDAIKSCVVR